MSSSYSDETVLSKLSSLNETQDAIVTVAQWLMFHRCVPWFCSGWSEANVVATRRRTAKRSVELWLQRLKESSAHRKLNLLYLANGMCIATEWYGRQHADSCEEIVQQSKVKNKPEFLSVFTPVCLQSPYASQSHDANLGDRSLQRAPSWPTKAPMRMFRQRSRGLLGYGKNDESSSQISWQISTNVSRVCCYYVLLMPAS